MHELLQTDDRLRYERKFIASGISRYEVETLVKLHPANFVESHQQRYVNSLYLDSASLQNYLDNVDGQNERVKIRIRWYGSLFGLIEKPVLELKLKRGSIGKKEIFRLRPLELDSSLGFNAVKRVLRDSEVTDRIEVDVLAAVPSLISRYQRQYFVSMDREFRITIDSQLVFYRFASSNNSFLQRSADYVNTVVELKYGLGAAQRADFITNHFPLRLTKNSKYVGGIDRLYLW